MPARDSYDPSALASKLRRRPASFRFVRAASGERDLELVKGLARKLQDTRLIERCPEVHGLPAYQDQFPLEVRDLCEDGADVDVREVRHSRGFAPRRLTRTLRKAK